MRKIFIFSCLIAIHSQLSLASEASYKEEFLVNVHRFANTNRFNYRKVNRDKYVNCIMQTRFKATLDQAKPCK